MGLALTQSLTQLGVNLLRHVGFFHLIGLTHLYRDGLYLPEHPLGGLLHVHHLGFRASVGFLPFHLGILPKLGFGLHRFLRLDGLLGHHHFPLLGLSVCLTLELFTHGLIGIFLGHHGLLGLDYHLFCR